jgi:glycosyltransferase involved in cell wall biosynthesis
MSKKIIVLYPNSFPLGGAATNRVIHICKALNQEGNNLKLYITRPTEKKNNIQATRKGIFEGIEFCYVNKNIVWPEKLIKKAISQFIGIMNTSIILIKEDYDIVLSCADYNFLHNFIYFLFIKSRQKKIVYAIDEFPWSVIYKTNSFLDKLYLKFFYKLFDALLVITVTLMEYYSSKIRKGAIMLHLPMTVELERFEFKPKPPSEDYIAYCGGDQSGMKDGIDILIRAFNIVEKEHPSLKLYIIGRVHDSIYKIVSDLQLEERVKFFGFVDRYKVPDLLINAKALCLARPNNIQAEGGFPTKLGEYLVTGKPVIVTNVGEAMKYLKNNVNAYIAEAGDIHDYASKISFVLDNYEESLRVGRQGRILAEEIFDYRKQGQKINNFLNEINSL